MHQKTLRSAVNKKKELRSLKRSSSTYEKETEYVLSSVDIFVLDRVHEKNVARSTISTIKIHQNKKKYLEI